MTDAELIKALLAGYEQLLSASDTEMGDGDLARNIAKQMLALAPVEPVEDSGLRPSSDVVDAQQAETPPTTIAMVPTKSEIHTIDTGSLEGHTRDPSCWCTPVQHAEDSRIWTHHASAEAAAAEKG